MNSSPQTAVWLDRRVIRDLPFTWEHVLWAGLALLALLTRFAVLDPRVMSHDEAQHTQLAWNLFSGLGYQHYPMTHGPLQIELVAFAYFLFGAGDAVSRIPAAVFGVAAVLLVFPFRRWIGRWGALAGGLFMAVSPFMMFYSRYVRNEAFVVVWGLLMFLAVARYLECAAAEQAEGAASGGRSARWLYLLAAVTALHYATKETAYIYVGLLILFLAVVLQFQFFRAPWADSEKRIRYFVLSFTGVALCAAAVIFFSAGRSELVAQALAAAPRTNPDVMVHTAMPLTDALNVLGLMVLAFGLAALAGAVAFLFRSFSSGEMRGRFPIFNLLIVLGTTLLPQLAAFPMALFNLNPWDGDPLARISDPKYIAAALACLVPLLVISAVIGLLWDRRKWLIYSGIFFGIYIVLYTTFFTNIAGIATGLIGNVNYWLAQQDVQRGSQPWYYYILIQIPVYEYLPALLLLCAPFVAWLSRSRTAPPAADPQNPPAAPAAAKAQSAPHWPGGEFPMAAFLGFWSVASLLAYTWAGEKMPWLTVHITLGFILLGGWVVGKVGSGLRGISFREPSRWLGLLILPASLAALLAAVGAFFQPVRPFSGTSLDALGATSAFVLAFLLAVGGILLLGWVWRDLASGVIVRVVFLGAAGLFAGLTFRTAWMANFINYDYATEYLVYAHSTPDGKIALRQIEDISRSTVGGKDLQFAYDAQVGWVMNWYFRDFPNRENIGEGLSAKLVNYPVVLVSDRLSPDADRLLGDTHYAYTYMRMWWPMMDYFYLTPGRILDAVESAGYRQALWNIWWSRDYTAYAAVSGENLDLASWPGGQFMTLYVRKDIANSIWSYNAPVVSAQPSTPAYADSVRTLAAAAVWGGTGLEPGQFSKPRGIAAAPDGTLYVADSGNNRIVHLSPAGVVLQTWGEASSGSPAPDGSFNEPWGVAVGPDGSVYVTDTWNNRIQKFTADGTFLKSWGTGGGSDEIYGFYGPRGIAVDSENRVFVADTGNKRVMVYSSEGIFLMQIGNGGFDSGQFDEPAGLAFGPDDRLYVADTWNRRVQVFAEQNGSFGYQSEWVIDGWEGQSTTTKPYLAVAPTGDVWVTDPGNTRVLVFDPQGKFLFTFGMSGNDESSFALPVGIAVGPDGTIYVADTDNDRVMVFAAQPESLPAVPSAAFEPTAAPLAIDGVAVKVVSAGKMDPADWSGGGVAIRPESPDDTLLIVQIDSASGPLDLTAAETWQLAVRDGDGRVSTPAATMAIGENGAEWAFLVSGSATSFTLVLPGGAEISLDSYLAP